MVLKSYSQWGIDMDRSDFDEILEGLTPVQRKVLKRFLAGATDEEIASELVCVPNNVSRHVSNVCKAFGFRNEEGEHYSYRDELVLLFYKYEPDWVSAEMRDRIAPPKPDPEYPGRLVELGSPFYIEPIGITGSLIDKCTKAVVKPGPLLRVRSPKRRGKTSLVWRVLDKAKTQGCQTVYLNLCDLKANEQLLSNLDQFLQWFCNTMSYELELESQVDSFWSKKLDSTQKCTSYFRSYIFQQVDAPIVLAIDEIDWLFDYPKLYEFFTLLRRWNNDANMSSIWKKLRIILSYSTEIYIKLNANKSPFNIGEKITLPLLNHQEIQALSKHYELKISSDDAIELMKLVGGHPYLIQLAFYHLYNDQISIDRLLIEAHTESGVYRDHLQELWDELIQKSTQVDLNERSILETLRQVTETESTVQLQVEQGFRLQGLGLVQIEGDYIRISCELYRRYFQKRLHSNP
jgi:hypothetical protein